MGSTGVAVEVVAVVVVVASAPLTSSAVLTEIGSFELEIAPGAELESEEEEEVASDTNTRRKKTINE